MEWVKEETQPQSALGPRLEWGGRSARHNSAFRRRAQARLTGGSISELRRKESTGVDWSRMEGVRRGARPRSEWRRDEMRLP